MSIRVNCPSCGASRWTPSIEILSCQEDPIVIDSCPYCPQEFKIRITRKDQRGSIELIEPVNAEILELDALEIPDLRKDQDLIGYFLGNKPFELFEMEIEKLRALNNLNTGDSNIQIVLRKQIFVGLISTLESYLFHQLVVLLFDDDYDQIYFKRFIENYTDFKSPNFHLNEFFKVQLNLKEIVKGALLTLNFHRLSQIKSVFDKILSVKFPKVVELEKLVKIRHDLVHRNGQAKNGVKIEIFDHEIINYINKVSTFVSEINNVVECDIEKNITVENISNFYYEPEISILDEDDLPF